MTRPASKTQDHTITVLKIGEARGNFPQMVSSLESGSSGSYVIGRYGKPAAARRIMTVSYTHLTLPTTERV